MGRRGGWHPAIGVALACALGGVTGVYACALDLDGSIACGDGYVDEEAGEECDPMSPESYLGACDPPRLLGQAACDPETCEIINDSEQCAHCGDGVIDMSNGEECDGNNVPRLCPNGEDSVQCSPQCELDFSACNLCGDGKVDAEQGEECDKADIGGLATPRPCAGADLGGPGEIDPLPAPNPALPYTFGETSTCTQSCRFVRLGCSYCNNDRLDGPTPLDEDGNLSLPELCDGDIFDLDELLDSDPNSICWDTPGQQPNVACSTNCLDFIPRDGDACCIQRGATCPSGPTASAKCCYQLAHPDEVTDPQDACQPIFVPGGGSMSVCR